MSICPYNKATGEEVWKNISYFFVVSLVAQSFSWCGKCVRLHVSYLSALMLLCPLQQDSKKRVVENGQKSIYICKTEFSLVFFRFRTIYLILLSLLLFLLVDFASDLFSYCTMDKKQDTWRYNRKHTLLERKGKKGDRQQCFKIRKHVPFYNIAKTQGALKWNNILGIR